MSKILSIDDDPKYQSILCDLLRLEGYEVDIASDPIAGLEMFKKSTYDLVLCDLIMNTVDGLQLVYLMKKINSFIPIIILTGLDDYKKEMEGFDLDIEDYVNKSVSFDLLIKRIEKRIRTRNAATNQLSLKSSGEEIVVNCKERKVYKENEIVKLTTKEYELLCFFLRNKNKIYTREEILENVWRTHTNLVDNRTVDTHIRKIRDKLSLSAINSVRGIGYEWFE